MSDQDNLSGTTIRGFELIRQIGVGGFGAVYNAYQGTVDREVAVKVIHEDYARQPDFIRRFEAEARIVARLEHMNIVPLYDYWRDPSGAYLVMRWLRGGSARSALEVHGPWPVTSVVRLLTQIAGALSIAHHHGVVHRDIKPENILLDESDNAYLSDFGISVDIFNDPDDLMIENLSFGSPAYMSPEQLTQRIATPLADIYSLGILAYELLTNSNPFPDETTAALMKKQVRDPIPSLSKTRSDLPGAMDVVIWRSTAKTPSARYQDAKTMATAFQEAAAPVMAREKDVPLLNVLTGTIQDQIATSGLFGSRRSDPAGTIEMASGPGTIELNKQGTLELNGPFGVESPEQQFNTLDLGDRMTFPPAEVHDQTLNLDSVGGSFGGAGTIDFEQELVTRNPYKGLRPFEEFDAADFFGRREIVELLLDVFEDSRKRFLAVVGPSGSGKSSLVRAGIIPQLRQGGVTGSEQWFIVPMVPGDDPFKELAETLLRVSFDDQPNLKDRLRGNPTSLHDVIHELLPYDDAELLIFIDQFEEVFTGSESEEDRQKFLTCLASAVNHPESNVRVILTLRADFYDKPLQYKEFGELLKSNTEILLPLSPAELEETITEPATSADLILEPGLSKVIVDDVYHQPGALPLLQYALTEMYERRNGRILEHKAYQEIGGVSGALAKRADDIYEGLSAEDQGIARQLFLRLVAIEGENKATRKRQIWTDLFSGIENRETAEKVIGIFTQYRLLTLDRDPVTRSPTIEIAHEALISVWDQLQQWINANRADLMRLQRLQAATNDWVNGERDASFLARGMRLGEFESLASDTALALGDDQKEFIQESVHLRERLARRTQMVIAALVLFSVIAVIFAVFALDRQRRAQSAEQEALTQADRANRAAQVSRSRELSAIALSAMEQNDLSLLLSVEALKTSDTFEARNSLLTGLLDRPTLSSYMSGHVGGVRSVAYSDNGSLIVSVGQDSQVRRWDGETYRVSDEPLTGPTGVLNAVDVNADATRVVAAGEDQLVWVWDTVSGEIVYDPLQGHEAAIWGLDLSQSGRKIASGDANGTLMIWDTETGLVKYKITGAHDDAIYAVAFSPDGTILATGGADWAVRFWDVVSGEMMTEPQIVHNNWVMSLAFSPNGNLLVSSGAVSGVEEALLTVWNVANGAPIDQFRSGHRNWIRGMDFDRSGQLLATASMDGSVRLWDLAQQEALTQLIGHEDSIWDVAFDPANLRLVTASADTNLIAWDVEPPQRPGESVIITNQPIEAIDVESQRDLIASVGAGQTVEIWDSQTGERVQSLSGHEQVINAVAFSPDGTQMASASADLTVQVWDVESGSLVFDPLEGHGEAVWDVVYMPDGKEIISAAGNGTVIRWNAQTGAMIGEPLKGQPEGVLQLAISADGQWLAMGGRDSSIVLLDMDTLEVAHLLDGHEDAISDLVFSPDGIILASSNRGEASRIHLWDVVTGEALGEPMIGHSDWVLGLAISPDGRMLASSGRDEQVILWDLPGGRMLGNPMDNHEDWVTSVVFSQDGEKLYSAGRDAVIVSWDVTLVDWMKMACQISNRQLTEQEWQQYFAEEPYSEVCEFTE